MSSIREQILNSIDYNASSGTPNIATAVTNLKGRGWTITLNGVAQ